MFLGFASKTLHEFRFSLSYQLQDVYELLTFPLSVFTVQDYHTEDFPHNNVITLYDLNFLFSLQLVPLIRRMESRVMIPLPFGSLQ